MDSDQQEVLSARESAARPPIPDFNAPTASTMVRELDDEFQKLKRENFNLKLRIYFLEEKGESHDKNTSFSTAQRTRTSSQYNQQSTQFGQQLVHGTDQTHRQPLSDGSQTHTQSAGNQTSSGSADFQQLRTDLEACRRENEKLRRQIQDFPAIGSNITNSNTDPLTHTTTDSTLRIDPNMPVSTYTVQFQQREEKLREENKSLREEITALSSQITELKDELERANKRHQAEMQDNEDREIKAQNVLKRLNREYETRVANLEKDHQRKIDELESYRHEPLIARVRFHYPLQEQITSNVNIEEYLQKIDQQNRIIKQLQDKINAEPAPSTPSLSNNSRFSEEQFERLNRELRSQTDTIKQLRAECGELRRSEQCLRKKIDGLDGLLDTSTKASRLSVGSTKSIIDDTQPDEDPQSSIAQVTLKLQKDADNVSGLTSRIGQLIHDLNELQKKLEEKDSKISWYERREVEVENRNRLKYESQIDGYKREMEYLKKQLADNSQDSDDFEKEKNRIRLEAQKSLREVESHFTEERRTLKEDIRRAHVLINEYKQSADDAKREYENLQEDLRKIQRTLEAKNTEDLERIIQEHKRAIEHHQTQFQVQQDEFRQHQHRLEQERNAERQRANQTQTELDTRDEEYDTLQTRYSQLQAASTNSEKKIQYYKQQLDQAQQDHEDELRRRESKYANLTQKIAELEEQVAVWKNRFQDIEDRDERQRNAYHQLEMKYQNVSSQLEERVREVSVLTRNYETVKGDLISSEKQISHRDTANKHLKEESTQLKDELHNLELRINIDVDKKYQTEYQRRFDELNQRKEADIQNIQKDKEDIETDLRRANDDRAYLENELQNANEAIKDYERRIGGLERALAQAKEQNTDNAERIRDLENELRTAQSQVNQTNQLQRKVQEKEELIQTLQNNRTRIEEELITIKSSYQSHIQDLEQTLETKENLIQSYSNTVQVKDEQINQLLSDAGDQPSRDGIETLQKEIEDLNRQIDHILVERTKIEEQSKRFLSEVQLNLQNSKQDLVHKTNELQKTEQRIDAQKDEINNLQKIRHSLTRDLQSAGSDREADLNRIRALQDEIDMLKLNSGPTLIKQHEHCENVISELKTQLQQRDIAIQELQSSLRTSDGKLTDARQAQERAESDFNRMKLRREQMEKELAANIDNRDQKIVELQDELSGKEQRINTLHQEKLNLDKNINELNSRLIAMERNPSDDSSFIASLRREIEERTQEIHHLQKLAKPTQGESPPVSPSSSNVITRDQIYAQRPKFDHLTPEELLYELDMAHKRIQQLNEQLAKKSPNSTELHNQIREVRNELERQIYVNQVLWRKLDALMVIHGSSTFTDLIAEFANHQDELAKLKAHLSQASSGKLDSGLFTNTTTTTVTDVTGYQRQINEKDQQIERLTKDLNAKQRELVELQNDAKGGQTEVQKLRVDLTSSQRELQQLNLERNGGQREVQQLRVELNGSEKEIQRLKDDLNGKQREIQDLTSRLNQLSKGKDGTGSQHRSEYDRMYQQLTNELQQANSEIGHLRAASEKCDQLRENNQRLLAEIQRLEGQLRDSQSLAEHYKTQVQILERRPPIEPNDASKVVIRSSELTHLLEEMRQLRRDLEQSIEKQSELQAKLDQNIRQSNTPREFVFSGRGVSYPDLRLIDAGGLLAAENSSLPSLIDEPRLRPASSGMTERDQREYSHQFALENERRFLVRQYIAGEVKVHENLRQLIQDIKLDFKAIAPQLEERLRSRTSPSGGDISARSLDEGLAQALVLMESYWRTDLPERNKHDEHPFVDQRLLEENKHLLAIQKKYIHDINILRQRYKEQSNYLDQLLVQLTKANRKKTDTGDYLALLLQPTLDVLQKARSNIEHHLQESNTNHMPPGSAQSHRRHRTNRQN